MPTITTTPTPSDASPPTNSALAADIPPAVASPTDAGGGGGDFMSMGDDLL
jgi:hypothetical protein